MLARCVQKQSAAWGWGERESAIIAPLDGDLAQTRSFMMTSIRIGGSKATQTCAEDAKKMKPSAAVERMRQPKQKAVARVGWRAPRNSLESCFERISAACREVGAVVRPPLHMMSALMSAPIAACVPKGLVKGSMVQEPKKVK